MPEALIVVSGALFSADGKILLLRRAAAPDCEEYWELPGGELEFGEAPEIGLVRCFAETAGLDISVDRPLGAWSEIEVETDGNPRHRVHIDYTVTLSAALLAVECDPQRHSAFVWLRREPALERLGVPGIRASAERAFAALARSRKNG